ncbi:LysR family transcriptional regulator [Burkholderia vietnamiensis]|uniref:LysR substrate-binding domain-containing protein n=1 Tax=Burkholderia vietnamiensis TaxID=60552 RepID=UPI0015943236|nr:LysR family transcriptional regulator [Burkholderia vietnamiensis]
MSIDLNRLRMFSTVAKYMNFGRAALELGITAATLSEHIRNLERDLGARLFNRTTRSVALTEAGARLLADINPSLTTIGEALAGFGSGTQIEVGTLRINGPRPALDFRVTPLIVEFSRQHPGIRIELVADDGFSDIVGDGFDAGVRYGEALAKDMIAVSLGAPQRFCVVGSSAYLEAHGRPSHPKELAGRQCFGHIFPRGNHLNWSFSRGGEQVEVAPRGPIFTTETYTQLQAARSGLGLALLFAEHCEADLKAGTLEEVLEDWSQPFEGPFLYYPERRLMPAPLRAFVDFVKQAKHVATDGSSN